MQNRIDSGESDVPATLPVRSGDPLSRDAAVRRRLLLRGIGKGTAVLGATVPFQTLAGPSLLTFDGRHQCSVSGMHSGVHSAMPSTSTCGGYSPGWWGQTSDGKSPRRAWPVLPKNWTYGTKCKTVFSQRVLSGDPTLFEVMSPRAGGKYSNTDEFHWICAWLNALSHSFNFPYTGVQVLAFYNQGIGTPAYMDALAFFKTFMETHTS
jgi:hypothetical protein